MSDTIRETISEDSISCLCGKGKIIHRKVKVVNLISTWGTYDDEYILDCDDCKAEGYVIDYIPEYHGRFLVKKIMKIDI